MRKTLQRIMHGEGAITDNNIHLFYHASERLARSEDGGYCIKKDKSYDFSAYYNILSVKKWTSYCRVENVSLELEIAGSFYIELMGYYTDDVGKVHKESIERFFYKKDGKRILCIDYPDKSIKSYTYSCISFKIEGGEECVLYSGRYTSDVDKKNIGKPKLLIASAAKEGSERIEKSIEDLSSDLLTDEEYKNAFSLLIFNSIFIKNKKKLHKNIRFESKMLEDKDKEALYSEALKINKSADFFLGIDSDALYKSEAIKRLYDFLSLLKPEYKDYMIEAAMLDDSTPGVQAPDRGRTRLFADKFLDSEERDLTIIENVIRNEAEPENTEFDIPGWWMFCVISDRSKSLFSGHELEHEVQKPGVITLNGFAYGYKNIPAHIKGARGIKAYEKKEEEVTDERQDIQEILLGIGSADTGTQKMFYRTEKKRPEESERGFLELAENVYYDFSTYFNSFSFAKWRKYTILKKAFLELDIDGEFRLELTGFYVDGSGMPHKEQLGRYDFHTYAKKHITVEFPENTKCDTIAFRIKAKTGGIKFYGGRYFTYLEPGQSRKPFITLITTTFKKEEYMEKNIRILKEKLFSDAFYGDKFNWIIVDNGRTLDRDTIEDRSVRVIYNPNVGGSGGFARGMIEAESQDKKATHIILMDDDVEFFVDSFKRIYKLLSFIRDEYANHFISGAMLEMEMPNVQHEDIGVTSPSGEHGPVKPRWDLNSWDCVIKNELSIDENPANYAGWWYCCIPTTVAQPNNLPLPMFIRGDDVEYSIRNNAKFITMNGICIWHQGFGNKFSAYMEFYQVHRNDLIWKAIHPHIKGINVIKRIKDLFWQEIYKFNYKGADLLLDAVEDYLRGPDFLESLDGESCMKEKKAKDNELYPLNSSIEALFKRETLYKDTPLAKPQKMLYDYSYNGQIIPVKTGNKTAVIPYGWGYWPGRQFMADTIYAVDMLSDTYAVYKKDRGRFKQLTSRYNKVIKKYNAANRKVVASYMKKSIVFTSLDFWEKYLQRHEV